MKYLTLIRHADARQSDLSRIDHNRSLSPAGKKQAENLGDLFKQHKQVFEKIFSSTAKRAVHTAELIAIKLGYPMEMISAELRIYEDQAIQLFAFLQDFQDQYESVAIIGHNPSLSELGGLLVGRQLKVLSTAGFIQLACNVQHWREIEPANAKLLAPLTAR